MKTFMGNSCGNGFCTSSGCERCKYYCPTLYGHKVPKWLGDLGFNIEAFLFTVLSNLK